MARRDGAAAEVAAGGRPHTLGAATLTVLASAAVPPRRLPAIPEETMAALATMPNAEAPDRQISWPRLRRPGHRRRDLACPLTHKIARARKPFPAVGVQHMRPGGPFAWPACLIARILGKASSDLGDVMIYPAIGLAGSPPGSWRLGCPLCAGPEGLRTCGFPCRGRAGEGAGQLAVSRCVCIVHEELDGWPASSVPSPRTYLDGGRAVRDRRARRQPGIVPVAAARSRAGPLPHTE